MLNCCNSLLWFRQNVIKVGSKSWLLTCSSNITLRLPSYTGSALKRELHFCNSYLSLPYFYIVWYAIGAINCCLPADYSSQHTLWARDPVYYYNQVICHLILSLVMQCKKAMISIWNDINGTLIVIACWCYITSPTIDRIILQIRFLAFNFCSFSFYH